MGHPAYLPTPSEGLSLLPAETLSPPCAAQMALSGLAQDWAMAKIAIFFISIQRNLLLKHKTAASSRISQFGKATTWATASELQQDQPDHNVGQQDMISE